ncbi:MAG: cyclic nucleotide-binding domain-containing protein [Bacteriovoracaceae bacterium]|nr:cyclic nucleotide-binding domain-containing protein [Bacteriovoracaceae bacterium]
MKYLIRLDREHINLIRHICLKENSFQSASTLFYEGQTPIVAYLVIDGVVNLVKNRRIKTTLKSGSLIGLKELMLNKPVPLEAKVEANSSLVFLDKSTIQEIINATHGSDLSMLFRELVEAS